MDTLPKNREDNRHPLGPPRHRFGRPAKLAFDRYSDPKTGRQRTNYTRLKINGVLAYDNIPGDKLQGETAAPRLNGWRTGTGSPPTRRAA